MTSQAQRGRDEMNLAVLPIARLGPSDKRTRLEYYGTFAEKGAQEEMVWIVDGGSLGLPTEFAERVLIALLNIGAQQKFADKKMYFTVYRVLKTLGLTINQRNYQEVEAAINRLVAITIYSDQAWYDHGKKKRITSKRAFHLIDEVAFHYEDEDDTGESYVVWGSRVWKSVQAGYLKYLDLDFYYGLPRPLTRRLFRFLDKMMAYQDEYQIDIFALQNKLGMAPAEYPSHLKRPISKAAQDLVDCGWLGGFEFMKHGKFHRVHFWRSSHDDYQLQLFTEEPQKTVIKPSVPKDERWTDGLGKLRTYNPTLYNSFAKASLVSITDGLITVSIGKQASRMNRVHESNGNTIRTLNSVFEEEITAIHFVD